MIVGREMFSGAGEKQRSEVQAKSAIVAGTCPASCERLQLAALSSTACVYCGLLD
jgi:hypothetical protein